MMDEVTNLVNVLRPQVKNYKERQIRSAILAEGYSEDIANKVVAELFKEQKDIKVEDKKEVREIKDKETKKDYYLEVDKLLEELKKINNVESNLAIPKRVVVPETNNNQKRVVMDNVAAILESKQKELNEIVIEASDESKIVLKDGKIINLNDYPRRDWRTYRDQGKTLAQIKNEKKDALRKEIYELKRNSPTPNIVKDKEDEISDMIYNQLKEKNVDVSDQRVKTATQTEANKLREQYKEKQIAKQELDLAADNIYKQLTRPSIDAPVKKEPIEEKKKEDSSLNLKSLDLDLNLDSNFNPKNDLKDDFDLGLDLNLDDKKKEKKK